MEKNDVTVKQAVDRLIEALKTDESYRISWKANIAMAFYDNAQWDKRTWKPFEVHETANKAADYFLDVLTK